MLLPLASMKSISPAKSACRRLQSLLRRLGRLGTREEVCPSTPVFCVRFLGVGKGVRVLKLVATVSGESDVARSLQESASNAKRGRRRSP